MLGGDACSERQREGQGRCCLTQDGQKRLSWKMASEHSHEFSREAGHVSMKAYMLPTDGAGRAEVG